jgi:hypothetical protein
VEIRDPRERHHVASRQNHAFLARYKMLLEGGKLSKNPKSASARSLSWSRFLHVVIGMPPYTDSPK